MKHVLDIIGLVLLLIGGIFLLTGVDRIQTGMIDFDSIRLHIFCKLV